MDVIIDHTAKKVCLSLFRPSRLFLALGGERVKWRSGAMVVLALFLLVVIPSTAWEVHFADSGSFLNLQKINKDGRYNI